MGCADTIYKSAMAVTVEAYVASTPITDLTDNIYILAPSKDNKRNEYKNGEFTGTSKPTTSSAPEPFDSDSNGEE